MFNSREQVKSWYIHVMERHAATENDDKEKYLKM